MFEVNDLIIYGSSGVCKVEAVGKLEIPGIPSDVDFYTLAPVYSESKMYTPVSNDKIIMRYIISNEDAKKFMDNVSSIETQWDDNAKVREQFYKDAIKSCDLEELVKVIKILHGIKIERIASGKKFTSSDEKYYKLAGDKLFGELAVALDTKREEVENCIIQKIQEQ